MLATIASSVWVLTIIAWCAIRYPYLRKAKRHKVARHRRSLEERLLLSGATLGLVVFPALWLLTGWPRALDYPPNKWLCLAGAVCMLAFLWLFREVHRQLGRNWSITLEIREDHQLVTEGLFKHIRHPMYTSFWLWAVGQALLLPNWLAGLAGLASIAALYFRRVRREEAMMRETFGQQYDVYMNRTKRIIPWIC